MSVHQVAERLGWPVETARRHLENLAQRGLVRRETGAPGARGRPPMTYRTTGGMDSSGPTDYRLLAEILAAGMQKRPDGAHDAFEFGHSWVLDRFPRAAAGSTAPVPSVQAVASALQAFLAEHSFEPTTELRGEHIDISLWQCPFLGLVDRYGEVICALHDGVIAGLIAASDVPATCHELRPFDRPDRCLVTLSPTTN